MRILNNAWRNFTNPTRKRGIPRFRVGLVMLASILLAPTARADDKTDAQPITVPFELLKTQHMTVQVKINGKGPYRLIFDTGAPVTLINNKVAKEADLFPKDFRRPFFAFFGSMGEFKVKSLEIGDLKLEGANAVVMDHPTVAAISNALGPIEGIIGFNFFAKYRMTLDYKTKTMTFIPTGFRPKESMQEMMDNIVRRITAGQTGAPEKVLAPGGLLGIKVHKDSGDTEPGVTVKTVYEGSPAALAGLKEGDRLLTLDSRWTDTPTDCHAAAALLTPGTPARAVVRREGREVEVRVEVRAGL